MGVCQNTPQDLQRPTQVRSQAGQRWIQSQPGGQIFGKEMSNREVECRLECTIGLEEGTRGASGWVAK